MPRTGRRTLRDKSLTANTMPPHGSGTVLAAFSAIPEDLRYERVPNQERSPERLLTISCSERHLTWIGVAALSWACPMLLRQRRTDRGHAEQRGGPRDHV